MSGGVLLDSVLLRNVKNVKGCNDTVLLTQDLRKHWAPVAVLTIKKKKYSRGW